MPPLLFENGLPDIPEEDYQQWQGQQWRQGAQEDLDAPLRDMPAPQAAPTPQPSPTPTPAPTPPAGPSPSADQPTSGNDGWRRQAQDQLDAGLQNLATPAPQATSDAWRQGAQDQLDAGLQGFTSKPGNTAQVDNAQPAPVALPQPSNASSGLIWNGMYYQDPNFSSNIQRYGARIAQQLGPAIGNFAIAQARLETGNGQELSTPYNYGNVGNTDENPRGGGQYSSPEEAADAWIQFITNNGNNANPSQNRYYTFLRAGLNGADVPTLARYIQRAGYATDPSYAVKLASIAGQPLPADTPAGGFPAPVALPTPDNSTPRQGAAQQSNAVLDTLGGVKDRLARAKDQLTAGLQQFFAPTASTTSPAARLQPGSDGRLQFAANLPVSTALGSSAGPEAPPQVGADTDNPGASAGQSPSDQQTPIAQYNERMSDGSWQQVTKMASGDYIVHPISPDEYAARGITPDSQTVYNADEAATFGFTSPDTGAPLLAATSDANPMSSPLAPASVPVAPAAVPQPTAPAVPAPQSRTGGLLGWVASHLPNVAGFQPNTPIDQQNPAQAPAGTTASQVGSDNPLVRPDLQSIQGINRFANELGQQAGSAVTRGTGLSNIPTVEGLAQQVLNPESFLTGPALAETAAVKGLAGAGARAAVSGGIGAASAAAQPAATPGDILAGALSGAATAGATEGLLRGAGALLSTRSRAALDELSQRASGLLNSSGEPVAAAASPAAMVDAVSHAAVDQAGPRAAEATTLAAPTAGNKLVDTSTGRTVTVERLPLPDTPGSGYALRDDLTGQRFFRTPGDLARNYAKPQAGPPPTTVGPAAAPAMGGGAAGDFARAIRPLNNLIGTFGAAIPKTATPQEAVRAISQADNAVTALGAAFRDAYSRIDLTPAERADVARILEGQRTQGASQAAVDVADAIQQTTRATWQMANRAGVLDGMVENYLPHMVRIPAEELAAQGGQVVTPSALSEWSRFARGRMRDENGNIRFPTLVDLRAYVDQEHPTWQVIDDPAVLMDAHVKSLATAANHAALGDFLTGYRDATGQPGLSIVRRPGDVRVNLPASFSRWVFKGPAPEEGQTVFVPGRGRVPGSQPGSAAVIAQEPILWARPDVAQLLDRYTGADLFAEPIAQGRIPQQLLRLGELYQRANRIIVGAKMLNPAIHGWNLLSETLSQYGNPQALRGIADDFRQAERVMNDPVTRVKLLQEAQLNLPVVRRYARQLAEVTGPIQADSTPPVLSGIGNAASTVADANHRLLFETVAQRLQLASYFGALRQGLDQATAAEYANAKFGQLSRSDLNPVARWVAQNAEFAGNWTTGTLTQLGSLAGRPGLLTGYAADLNPAQRAQLAGALRGDVMRGMAMLVGAHALINHALSGHFPWQNETGRWLDVDTGQKDAQGREIYVTDPFFRRMQDMLHLFALPGTPMAAAMGTTTPVALANKAAPLLGTARDLATGQQYLTPEGGPPIVAPGSDFLDGLAQVAALAANQLQPIQVNARMATKDEQGMKLPQPRLTVSGPAGVTYTEGQGVRGPANPADAAAGMASVLTNARQAAGPRYLDSRAFAEGRRLETFGPDLTKLYADSGVGLPVAPDALRVSGRAMDMTATERQVYNAAKADALSRLVARTPLPQPLSARRAVLKKLERQADVQAAAATRRRVGNVDFYRRSYVESASPAPNVAALIDKYSTAYTGR